MRNIALAIAASAALLSTVPPARAQELTGTLKKIRDSGSIMLGLQTESVPFSYNGPEGKPIGYAVDLCMRVTDGLKARLNLATLEVKTRTVVSAARIPLLTGNVIDLTCGSMTNSLDRQAQISFTHAHFISGVRALVPTASKAQALKDLAGERVVVATGTTAVRLIFLYEKKNEVKFNKLYAGNFAQGFSMLQEGKANAFLMDDILLSGILAQNRAQPSYRLLSEVLHNEPYAIAMRRDPEFKKAVDEIMASLLKGGEAEKLYQQWFMSTIPPGINLQVPLSAALREAFANPTDKGVAEPE